MSIKYNWDQSFHLITIHIEIEDVKVKDITVEFKTDYLRIKIKDKILDGFLDKNIYVTDSYWYIDNQELVIEMSKIIVNENYMWVKLFKDDEVEEIKNFDVEFSDLSSDTKTEYIKSLYT